MLKPSLNQSQSGNAIMIILVAVALFAALSFVFSNTSRNSSRFVTDAEADAYANQIIAYGNEVKQAVKRLTLRGCQYDQISFENPQTGYAANPNAPADKSCDLNNLNGGGLTYSPPSANALTAPIIPDIASGFAAKINNVGDNANSDILWSIYNIKLDVCKKLNNVHGIVNPSGSPPSDSFSAAQFDIDWSNGIDDTLVIGLGDESSEISGKTKFCYYNPVYSNYAYVIVLIAR